MAFRQFMQSEDFKDYHEFYLCSRNNLYKFSQSKFRSTLEYFQHLYQIDDINVNECKQIFESYDIPTVPSPKIRFYIYKFIEENVTLVKFFCIWVKRREYEIPFKHYFIDIYSVVILSKY